MVSPGSARWLEPLVAISSRLHYTLNLAKVRRAGEVVSLSLAIGNGDAPALVRLRYSGPRVHSFTLTIVWSDAIVVQVGVRLVEITYLETADVRDH